MLIRIEEDDVLAAAEEARKARGDKSITEMTRALFVEEAERQRSGARTKVAPPKQWRRPGKAS